jgi:hypothetical protein
VVIEHFLHIISDTNDGIKFFDKLTPLISKVDHGLYVAIFVGY